jgi:Rad3-related DNA helicase
MLTDVKNLIIDEAHDLEPSAIVELGMGLSQESLERTMDRIAGGLTARLERASEVLSNRDERLSDSIRSRRQEIEASAGGVRSAAERFFSQMNELVRGKVQLKSFAKLRLKSQVMGGLAPSIHDLLRALSDLTRRMESLESDLKNLSPTSPPKSLRSSMDELTSVVAVLKREVKALADEAHLILSTEETKYVGWTEARAGKIHLRASPIDLGRSLCEVVYSPFKGVILASDALAVDGNLDYTAERSGIDLLPEGRRRKVLIPGSTDYEGRLLLCVPVYLSDPTSERFMEEVSNLSVAVSRAINGRGVFLFTSYSMLNSVHHRVKAALAAEDVEVLGQRLDGDRRSVVERFTRNTRSILMCTDGFWDGIEPLGDELKCLTVVKLPFPIPSEPTVEARMELLKSSGLNSFEHLMVPQAVLKFRRYFGRLTHGRKSKGAIVVADRRIVGASYGPKFFRSLPLKDVWACEHEGELVGRIRGWLK